MKLIFWPVASAVVVSIGLSLVGVTDADAKMIISLATLYLLLDVLVELKKINDRKD